ncbi:MAG: hypothetical protein LJE85_01695 [Gammaproteobacteria bacterium]|jgi:uncharacterized pyridoxamine 5'-phosphate oxidase family protein|nr:hypothetical protein [Gammaproteobacteria bacterium]
MAGISLLMAWVNPLYADNNTSVADSATSQQTAIQKMAVIMHRLKHFPSPQSKQTLEQIISDPASTGREKDLAGAMLRLNHRALVDDKIKLKKIMENENASSDERDLASIIYNLDHRPTKGDKKRLKEMMQ